MEREIKFRGLIVCSKDFAYGDLIHGVGYKKGKLFILPNVVNLASMPGCHPLDGYEVQPETVGQYTGLKDKNGVEIYEGDILSLAGFSVETKYLSLLSGEVVFFNGSFSVKEKTNGYYLNTVHETCTIIGNIYQNTELL